MPLHFDAFQQMMDIEEDGTQDSGGIFRQKVFGTDGDLLVIDVGCGPMTAGLALGDWYAHHYKQPLNLNYVGIDDSEHCRSFAANFASHSDLFHMSQEPAFYDDCTKFDFEHLKKCITSNGTLLFIFSYILGQDSCKPEDLQKWASFVRQVMTVCKAKHNLFAYTNVSLSDNPDTDWANSRYRQFRQLMQWDNPPQRGRYGRRVLRSFNEPNDPLVKRLPDEYFCHLLVDATLVEKKTVK